MSKSRRGKSASTNEVSRWEAELIQTQFNEETWKSCLFFLIPNHADDKEFIDILSEVVGSGLRKLFSVITYEGLMKDVKEYGKGNTGGGGKGKGAAAVKAPPFHEVCEQVKPLVDQGETIPPPLMARLLKFKLIHIKSKDIDRREEEKKAAKAAESAKNKDDKGKKSRSPSGKRSKSPGKKKGKGKEADVQPSPKKNTKLKRRGDVEDTFKTIDDEPDEEGSPQHYILIHGVLTAQVLYHLSEIGISTDAIITIRAETYDRLGVGPEALAGKAILEDVIDPEAVERQQKEEEEWQQKLKDEQELDTFLKESANIVMQAPSGHKLKDMARYQVVVRDKTVPEGSLRELDADKKTEFGTAIFEDVADVCYNMLNQHQQYKQYLQSMKLIQVPVHTTHGSSAATVPSVGDVPSSYSVSATQVAESAAPTPVETDIRYYNHLMDSVPTGSHSVPLVLHCLLEQVSVTVNENNPLDQEIPTRPDGLNNILAAHITGRACKLALASDEQQALVESVKEPKSKNHEDTKPVILQYGDQITARTYHLDKANGLCPLDAELQMLKLFPQNAFSNFSEPLGYEFVERAACYNELRQFCSVNSVSRETLDRALKQYAFEGMLLKTASEYGDVVEPRELDNAFELYSNPWDYPYNKLNEFQAGTLQSKEGTLSPGTVASFRNLDDWCFVEHFDQKTLLQVLEEARLSHPYVDAYYYKRDHSLLLALHNPPGPYAQSSSTWETQLHSNVGFRNYLEHVVDYIEDWVTEQERIKREANRTPTPPPPAPEQPVVPLKVGSRYGLQTRAEVAALKAEEEEAKSKKGGKGRKSARGGSRSPRRSAKGEKSESPDKKDKDKKREGSGSSRRSASGRAPSAKGSLSVKSERRGGRSRSRVSMNDEPEEAEVAPAPPPVEDPYEFIGYDVGDNLVHASGSLSTMFPCDGGQIRVERNSYIQGSRNIRVSVLKDGNMFVLHFLEPIDEVLKQEEIDGEESESDTENLSKTMEETKPEAVGPEEGIEKSETEANEKEELAEEPTKERKPKGREPRPFCDFSSFVAQLSDGMVVSLSGYGPDGTLKKKEPKRAEDSLAGQGGSEPSQAGPVASPSPQPKAVSPKVRKKQDEEARKMEELQLQQQEEERLRQEEEAKKKAMEEKLRKPFQRLFVSSPDGLRVDYFNDGLYPSEGDMGGVVVRQRYPIKGKGLQACETARQRPAMGEIWRTITTSGTVIKLLITGGVQVLFPDGAVSSCHSFPVKQAPPTSKPGSAAGTRLLQDTASVTGKKGGRGTGGAQKSVEEPPVPALVEPDRVPEWLSTGVNGQRIITRSDGSHETLASILCSFASCPHTEQALRTREDNVVIVDRPNGTRVVEHADGTRITTFYEDIQKQTQVADNETGEEARYTTERVQFVKVECAGFATVTFQNNTGACSTTWGNATSMVTQANGSSVMTKSDGLHLQVDRKGVVSYVPREVAPNKEFPLPEPALDCSNVPAGVYIMRSTSQSCCELKDARGAHFSVISNGEMKIERQEEIPGEGKTVAEEEKNARRSDSSDKLCADVAAPGPLARTSKTPHVPRYFILHSDGTGSELLRDIDVAEFLEQAQKDPISAVLKSPVEGHPDVTGLTILRPHSGGVDKIWLKQKDEEEIIPEGLRERDFKSMPAWEQKTQGPCFGTNAGAGLNIGSRMKTPNQRDSLITCPKVLEFRQLLQNRPLTMSDRHDVTTAVHKYGLHVARREGRSDSLLPEDPREESEKLAAEELHTKMMPSEKDKKDSEDEQHMEFMRSGEVENVQDETRGASEKLSSKIDCDTVEQQYTDAITPDPVPPPPPPKWKRPAHEWEHDRIELAELQYGQHALRYREVPPYFETAQGQSFLKGVYSQNVPDIDSLTAELAKQTRHPPPGEGSPPDHDTPQPQTTIHVGSVQPTEDVQDNPSVEVFSHPQMDSNKSDAAVEVDPSPIAPSATPNNLRPTNPTPGHADGSGTPTPLRPDNPTPAHASKPTNPRPTNPTPAKASGDQAFLNSSPPVQESPQWRSNLPSVEEIASPQLQEMTADSTEPDNPDDGRLPIFSATEAHVGAKSLYFDVTGQPRTSKVKLPTSILSGKPGSLPNTQFMEVEDPVRRRVHTVSVTGGDLISKDNVSGLRGFELLPPKAGFGVLKEGCTYQYTVQLKNTGIDSCRFKIKQPPPSTGLKVLYSPGPVAAGMNVPLTIEIFAVAVGVVGESGVGQVGHHVEIVTETDVLYLPVYATILTAYEFESRYGDEPSGLGPGTRQITDRPPSRDAIRPRRDESFPVGSQ